MQLSPAIPILRIFSEQKAREHYLDFLGFTCEWEHRFEDGMPLYMEVRRGELVIHLSEHHGDATPGSTIFVHVGDIDPSVCRKRQGRQLATTGSNKAAFPAPMFSLS